jgi:hypothetical protein
MYDKKIENKTFRGERPLYKLHDATVSHCTFLDEDGESPIKESNTIKVENCIFHGKYPFWHNENVLVENTFFSESSRAAIWYSTKMTFDRCKIEAPKIMREVSDLQIRDSELTTHETLWDSQKIRIENSKIVGEYFLYHTDDVEMRDTSLVGKYGVQHVRRGQFRNCRFLSKDLFWNSEDITVYDSIIEGEYFGWYSKNLKLVNCKIIGTQPLCYAENLVMENCEMFNTDLCFEYSTLDAEVVTVIDSIKNPSGGRIKAFGINNIIRDDDQIDHEKTKIIVKKVQEHLL